MRFRESLYCEWFSCLVWRRYEQGDTELLAEIDRTDLSMPDFNPPSLTLPKLELPAFKMPDFPHPGKTRLELDSDESKLEGLYFETFQNGDMFKEVRVPPPFAPPHSPRHPRRTS